MLTKKKIKDKLESMEVYDSAHEYLIDELYYCVRLIKQAKKEIKDKGLLVKGSSDPDSDYVVKNPAFNIYNDGIKNMLNISRKLGLSPRDQKEIINAAENKDDGFDELLED